jgi:hypothetical protein
MSTSTLRRSARRSVSRASEAPDAGRVSEPPSPPPYPAEEDAHSPSPEAPTHVDASLRQEDEGVQAQLAEGRSLFDEFDDLSDELYYAEQAALASSPAHAVPAPPPAPSAPLPVSDALGEDAAARRNLVLQDQLELLRQRVESLTTQLASAEQVSLGYRLKLQEAEAQAAEQQAVLEKRVAQQRAAAERAREFLAKEKEARHQATLELAKVKADLHNQRVTREEKWAAWCATKPATLPHRVPLHLPPFKTPEWERDHAAVKQLGAEYDRSEKCWFAPANQLLYPFAMWL